MFRSTLGTTLVLLTAAVKESLCFSSDVSHVVLSPPPKCCFAYCYSAVKEVAYFTTVKVSKEGLNH